MHYFPLAWPFFLLLILVFFVEIALIEIGILRYAYEKIGVPHRYVLAILGLTLLGSAINIPVAQLPPEEMVSGGVVDFFGMSYVIPVVREWPGPVLAINVGGALIPAILSFYLLFKNKSYLRMILAIAAVTAVVHWFAQPVRGVGVSVPIFIPPLITVLAAVVFNRQRAAPTAYIAGSLGTLLGADILNLGRMQGLGAPVASIGGAGTFDAVFLSGIIAVLLAPASGPASEDKV